MSEVLQTTKRRRKELKVRCLPSGVLEHFALRAQVIPATESRLRAAQFGKLDALPLSLQAEIVGFLNVEEWWSFRATSFKALAIVKRAMASCRHLELRAAVYCGCCSSHPTALLQSITARCRRLQKLTVVDPRSCVHCPTSQHLAQLVLQNCTTLTCLKIGGNLHICRPFWDAWMSCTALQHFKLPGKWQLRGIQTGSAFTPSVSTLKSLESLKELAWLSPASAADLNHIFAEGLV